MGKAMQSLEIAGVGMLGSYDATHLLNTPFTVVLEKSVKILPCADAGGNGELVIPDPDGLIKAVAQARVLHSQKLNGPDLKFLRSALELKAKEFAKIIDITPEHMSRLENGDKTISPQTEMLVRMYTFVSTIPFTSKKEDNGERIGQLVGSFFNKFQVMPVRSADENLELRFSRAARKGNAGKHCSCSADEGFWEEPPNTPLAA